VRGIGVAFDRGIGRRVRVFRVDVVEPRVERDAGRRRAELGGVGAFAADVHRQRA
jgi:hypothetical protein